MHLCTTMTPVVISFCSPYNGPKRGTHLPDRKHMELYSDGVERAIALALKCCPLYQGTFLRAKISLKHYFNFVQPSE